MSKLHVFLFSLGEIFQYVKLYYYGETGENAGGFWWFKPVPRRNIMAKVPRRINNVDVN